MSELEKIPGTGNEGRVTKKDILEYVSRRNGSRVGIGAQINIQVSLHTDQKLNLILKVYETTPSTLTPNYLLLGNVEIIEMDRMRKLIAKHMVESKHTSPHVTSFTEADVTNMVLWREKSEKGF